MNELIPKTPSSPVEKVAPLTEAEDTVLDPEQYIITKELAPDVPTIEKIAQVLQMELQNATDYEQVMTVLEAAVAENGHQTIETVLLAICTEEPSADNQFYLSLIGDIAEAQTILSQESYEDPDFEGLRTLSEMVDKYTEEEIALVAGIANPAEAFASSERKQMKDDIAPLYKVAVRLCQQSKAALDEDHTQYPEFWKIMDKFEAMHQAVGAINTIEKTVRHDLKIC